MKQAQDSSFFARVETAGDKLRTESVGDYSIPDYQPEIRRVLRVRTRVLPSGRYRRGGRTECAGLCVHTVLYSTDLGQLAALDVTSEYSFSFAAEDEALVWLALPQIEGVSCRLGGPRRLSIRAALTLTPHVYGEVNLCEEDGELCAADTVKLTHPLRTSELSLLSKGDLEYHDTKPLDAGMTLLASDGTAEVLETQMTERGAEVKGEIVCSLLLLGDGDLPTSMLHRIPFETTLECEKPSEGRLFASATLSSFEARVASEEGGGTRLLIDAGIEIDAELLTPKLQSPVVDAFSLKSPLVARKEIIPYTELLGTHVHRQAIVCETTRSESDSEDACAVLDTGAAAHIQSVTRENDTLRVTGECRVDMALALGSSSAEGRPDYMAASYASPFSALIPLPDWLSEDAELEILPRVSEVRGRIEPAGLSCEAQLVLTLRAARRRMIVLAVGMEEGGESSAELSEDETVAVYPSERDSVWSIARRYRISPERIAAQNGIPHESLGDADLPSSLDGRARLLLMK